MRGAGLDPVECKGESHVDCIFSFFHYFTEQLIVLTNQCTLGGQILSLLGLPPQLDYCVMRVSGEPEADSGKLVG